MLLGGGKSRGSQRTNRWPPALDGRPLSGTEIFFPVLLTLQTLMKSPLWAGHCGGHQVSRWKAPSGRRGTSTNTPRGLKHRGGGELGAGGGGAAPS